MPQVHFVGDDELGVARFARLGRAEEAEQCSIGSQHPRQLIGELLRGFAIEVIDQVPAKDAVDTSGLLRKTLLQKCRQRLERSRAHVPIEVREDVLDEDLAPELLTEK